MKNRYGVRQDRTTGHYVPQLNDKDMSPTSADEGRALEIARQLAEEADRTAPLIHTPGRLSVGSDFTVDGLKTISIEDSGPAVACFVALVTENTTDSGVTQHQRANAERLVHCWNHHDDLIAALENCEGHLRSVTGALPGSDSEEICNEARAVIDKAKTGKSTDDK